MKRRSTTNEKITRQLEALAVTALRAVSLLNAIERHLSDICIAAAKNGQYKGRKR